MRANLGKIKEIANSSPIHFHILQKMNVNLDKIKEVVNFSPISSLKNPGTLNLIERIDISKNNLIYKNGDYPYLKVTAVFNKYDYIRLKYISLMSSTLTSLGFPGRQASL